MEVCFFLKGDGGGGDPRKRRGRWGSWGEWEEGKPCWDVLYERRKTKEKKMKKKKNLMVHFERCLELT